MVVDDNNKGSFHIVFAKYDIIEKIREYGRKKEKTIGGSILYLQIR
jgi:hypothetical protein